LKTYWGGDVTQRIPNTWYLQCQSSAFLVFWAIQCSPEWCYVQLLHFRGIHLQLQLLTFTKKHRYQAPAPSRRDLNCICSVRGSHPHGYIPCTFADIGIASCMKSVRLRWLCWCGRQEICTEICWETSWKL